MKYFLQNGYKTLLRAIVPSRMQDVIDSCLYTIVFLNINTLNLTILKINNGVHVYFFVKVYSLIKRFSPRCPGYWGNRPVSPVPCEEICI